MQFTSPQVHLIAYTSISYQGMQSLLNALQVPEWKTDADSDGDMLAEVAGRLCYKSFGLGLNPNITKIREGNRSYLMNILKSTHFAILEHIYATFAITDCSRVFTHELVRHRMAAYSQESLRFVRLDEIRAMFPKAFMEHPEASKLSERFVQIIQSLEGVQIELAELLRLDAPDLSFEDKKKLTSSMRRLAPLGLATNIMFTANVHSLRNMIYRRTNRAAEEEIRRVFGEVFKHCVELWPAMMQDAQIVVHDGLPEVHFESGV
jgi:thymidylate synthase (FAD)